MGYVTDERGRLCCERCSQSGGVIRRRCPSGYCGPDALCGPCFSAVKASGEWTRIHAGCAEASLRFKARETAKARMRLDGTPYVISALETSPGTCHVIFQDGSRHIGRFVPTAVYQCSRARDVVTLADLEKLAGSTLPVAPEDFS